MSRRRRCWTLALFAASVACVPARSREPASVSPARPQATLHDVRMRVFKGSDLTLQGRAARLSFHRSTRDVTAEEALLQLHPASRPVELRAPALKGNLDSRAADLSGGVQILGAGMSGETERARFDGPAGVASGDRPVTLRGPGYSIRASAFQLDFAQEAFDFEGDVATELQGASR